MSLSPNGDAKLLLNNVVVHDNEELSPEGLSPKSDLTGVENKYHLDEIIPHAHSHRTIVLCFDGTGDQFSEDVCMLSFLLRNLPADVSQNSKNSNIVQFFSMLRKDNKSEQMVYYQVRQLILVVPGPLLNDVLCLGRYWNLYHTRNCNSLHGQGFKDAGYDARQSFGCTYYG
jgi:Uncharacterized alpha/beta hydrolase domain (DUF2235)